MTLVRDKATFEAYLRRHANEEFNVCWTENGRNFSLDENVWRVTGQVILDLLNKNS